MQDLILPSALTTHRHVAGQVHGGYQEEAEVGQYVSLDVQDAGVISKNNIIVTQLTSWSDWPVEQPRDQIAGDDTEKY